MAPSAPPEADRVSFLVTANHLPLVTRNPRAVKDPDAILLELDGLIVPAVDGFVRDDGTSDPDGRNWSIHYAGDVALSARRGDTPGVEIAGDAFHLGPVTMDDPLIHPTPYLDYGLPPLWEVLSGSPGGYSLQHVPIDYNPPAPQMWRISIVNDRTDSAISGELFEVADDLSLVPGGWHGPLFEHVPPGGTISNREVTSPRVRIGLFVWAEAYPDAATPTDDRIVRLAPGNAWGDVPQRTLRMPDGSIMQFLASPATSEHPVNWVMSTQAFMCRDPEYKDLVLAHAQGIPRACWGIAAGPRDAAGSTVRATSAGSAQIGSGCFSTPGARGSCPGSVARDPAHPLP